MGSHMPLHDAVRGYERAADAYERGRPDYPPEAVEAAAAALRLGPGRVAVELGAGTGKLTRLLAGRGPLLAVEPVPAMRRRLRAVAGAVPVAALAETLPLRDACAEGVVAASAFHWFDGPRALREIARVLRPGGRLALLWNVRDDAVEWIARLSEIVNRREGDAPRYRKGLWRAAFDAAPGLFGPLAETRFAHVQRLSPDGVVDRVASISFVAALPEPDRAAVLDEVRALLASHPETRGREDLALPYRTDLFTCERA
jgi:SAM-dependent methyltransferase